METPSSMRRVTRSHTSAASQKNKQEDTVSTSRNGERAAMFDLTNDSPIVGLATGSRIERTPSTWGVKNRAGATRTPGSGETLLRGQVKTLLQNVEEEAALVGKLPSFRALSGLPTSPLRLPATTPANTPQFPDMDEEGLLMDAKMPCVTGDTTINPQVVVPLKQEESLDSQECLINRALLFDDSPGKSETSEVSTISSSLTNEGSESGYSDKSTKDDSSSIWFLQVNASIQEDDDEDMVKDEEEEEEFFSDLCEGLSRISVRDTLRLAECTGKHTRFIYSSEDEIEREEEVTDEKVVSPNVLVLRGLPEPEGKHMRFPEEDED